MKSTSNSLLGRLSLILLLGLPLNAGVVFRAAQALGWAEGPGQLCGDLVATDSGAAAVYAPPSDTTTALVFYRFGPDAQLLLERPLPTLQWPCYEPALCHDGQTFGVAFSGFTQAFFVRLAPDGTVLAGPVALPGLPVGEAEAGRTGGFRIRWTGQDYAIFGLWFEREYPDQDLTYGDFYTHLRYWRLNAQGQVLTQKELRTLSPIRYPTGAGSEKDYYDVAWTGAAYFLAYFGESQSGPPSSVYYQLFDLDGRSIRAESRLLANQVCQGPKLAWNGGTVAATALKTISVPDPNAGNYMYLRCFGPDGTPRAVEVEYGQRLGYGPVVSWIGDRFLTAYCYMHDIGNLGYTLMFSTFDESGTPADAAYPLRNKSGQVVIGRGVLGVDLQIAGTGNILYAKSQNSDAWGITTTPLWFTLENHTLVAPQLAFDRQGDTLRLRWPMDAAPFRLQEVPALFGPAWTDVAGAPTLGDAGYELTLPMAGNRFFRLIH